MNVRYRNDIFKVIINEKLNLDYYICISLSNLSFHSFNDSNINIDDFVRVS
jgi:hypothetical protein